MYQIDVCQGGHVSFINHHTDTTRPTCPEVFGDEARAERVSHLGRDYKSEFDDDDDITTTTTTTTTTTATTTTTTTIFLEDYMLRVMISYRYINMTSHSPNYSYTLTTYTYKRAQPSFQSRTNPHATPTHTRPHTHARTRRLMRVNEYTRVNKIRYTYICTCI